MDNSEKNVDCKRSLITLNRICGISLIELLLVLLPTQVVFSQPEEAAANSPSSVPIILQSAEITHFGKPFKFRGPKFDLNYQEALVIKIKADHKQYHALPPSRSPVLYVGSKAYPIFHVDRHDKKGLILTFHITDWTRLEDNVPIVLTVEHLQAAARADPHALVLNKASILDMRR